MINLALFTTIGNKKTLFISDKKNEYIYRRVNLSNNFKSYEAVDLTLEDAKMLRNFLIKAIDEQNKKDY